MDQILIIDDDAQLGKLLTEYFGDEGFQVDTAKTGELGLEQALRGSYKLIVLDVMLPALNGFDVLRNLRQHSNTPVIMLTARCNDVDRIVGLEMGADDYLSKPFNPRELGARVRAVLRRSTRELTESDMPESQKRIRISDIEIDPGTRTAWVSEEEVDLTSVEFSLLQVLMQKAGQLVSREELAQAALGRFLSAHDRSIDVHVSKLRKKLGTDPSGADRIKTVRSAGYLYAYSTTSDTPRD